MSEFPHKMAALTFKAENQPIDGEPKYNETVGTLATQIEAGEISLEDANAAALDTLVSEVFPTPARSSADNATDDFDGNP